MSLKQNLLDNSNYPPSDDNGGIKSYLSQFATDTSYDDLVTQYANNVTADQSDLKFTGYTKDRDYLLEDASDFGYDDLIEFKAQNQSNWEKRGRGLSRLGFKTAMNILEMPGIAFGAAEAALTGDPYALINNGWSNAIKSANEWFDEEVAPVYVKKAVRDGNLWDNIKSVDFWATEGADGLAFALSALVPGAAVKGLKLGSKVANGLAKSKGAKYLQKVDDKVAKMLGTGGVADTTDIAAATAFNTIYEAGMEAQMGMDSYKTKLADMFANNEISQDDYAALSNKTGNVGANIFAANAALLLGPNAMMSKSLFGKAMPKKQLGKFKRVDGKYVPEATQLSKKQKALKGIKDGASLIGKSTVSEGFVEEAGQMVAEKFNVEGTIQDYLGEESKSLTELYADVVNSTEGQKAIMLGGVFGTGMTAVGNIKNRKPTKERNQQLADMMSRGANLMDVSINGVYKTDEQGNIEFDKGKPVIDQAKLANFGSEMEFVESINNAKDDIVEQVSRGEMTISEAAANTAMLDETLKKQALLSFVHAQDEGLEVLENYLENGSGIESLYASELENNPEFDIKGAKQKLKGELIAEATSLQKDLKYAQDYMHFDNQLGVNQNDPHYGQYMSKLHQDYTIANSNVRLADAKINELNSAKDKYQVVDYETLDNKGLFMDNIDREIATYERTKEALEAKIKSYTDPKVQKKAYEAFSKQQTELEKVNEEAKELDKSLTEIDNATNRTEVAEIIEKADTSSEVKKAAIEKKRAEKEKAFDKQREKVVEKINEDAETEEVITTQEKIEHNEALDYLREEFEEGEIVALPEGIDTDLPLETYLQITEFHNDGSITFLDVDTNLVEVFSPYAIDTSKVESIPEETEGVDLPNQNIINEDTVKKTDTTAETDPKMANEGAGTSEGYLEYFQLNGQDKKGTPVQFAVLDPGSIKKDTPAFVRDMITKSKKAIDIYKQLLAGKPLTEAQEDLFTGYFPLQVNITGTNHSSFIHAEYRNNKSKPEQKIRRQILNVLKAEVAKGNPVKITDLSTTILNQGKGKLSLEEKKGVYNSLNDLKNIQDQGGLENLEFGILNDVGILVNPYDKESIKGSTVYNPDWKGAIFVMINRDSTGEKFPLHVNISRMSEQHAGSLYDLGVDVINNPTVTNNTRLSEMDNYDKYSTEFAEELDLIVQLGKRSKEEITVNDLTRFMYFTGSSSPKSKLQINDKSLVFGTSEIKTGEELTPADRDEFVDWVVNNKNRNINGKSLSNSKYRKYIIDNKVLFSNAKANVPLFSKDTDLFLDVNVKYNKPVKSREETIKEEIKSLERSIDTQKTFKYNTDSSRAQDIANDQISSYKAEIKKLNEELEKLKPTQKPQQTSSDSTSFNVENGTQGSLQKDGYMAFNDNSDHSQDSVRIENGWAMVADGVSSNKNSKGFADALLKELAKDPVLEVEVVKNIIEDISKKYKDAAATLALTKKNPDGSFSYFTLGDSQVIVVDKNGKAKQTFAQVDKNGKIDYGNSTHAAVAGVGIAGDFQTGKIKLNAGEKLVIASDGIIDVFQYRDGTTKEITDFYNKVTSVFDTNLLAQISEASFEELSSIVKGDKQAKSKVAMSILLGLEKAGLLYDTMANNPSLVNSLSLLAKGDDNSFIVLDNSFNGSKTQQPTQQTGGVEAISKRISKLKFNERINALKKEGIIASDVTYNLGKRFPVILNVNGTKVAFYRSSEGTGGKEKGSWTPMFGFGESKGNPWLIKGSIEKINNAYNSTLIKQYQELLNKTLNWDHSLDKGKVKDHPYFKSLKATSSKEAFNNELYGVEDLGIVNNKSDVSGFIESKINALEPKQQTGGVTKMTPSVKKAFDSLYKDYKESMDSLSDLESLNEEHNEQLNSLQDLISSLNNSPKNKAIKKGAQLLLDELTKTNPVKNNDDSTRNSEKKVVTLQKQTKKEVTKKRKKKTNKFKSGASGINIPGVKNTTTETTTNSSTPVPGEQTTSTEKPEEICNGDGEVMGSMSTSLKGAKPAKPSNRFNKFK